MTLRRLLLLPLLLLPPAPAPADGPVKAAAFRRDGQAVAPVSPTAVIAEAEEFRPTGPGWQPKGWGENYYCATFANSFLSRKAFLGAPEQCDRAAATIEVEVPKAGTYLALVRYEAAYRFETQFTLKVEQNGKTCLERLYGARSNVKIWAFKEGLKREVAWDWGAGENVVWEGHDAAVTLAAGKARLTLVADRQPEPAARRNVDLVMLTNDTVEVKKRIAQENYLPLDGMLTQAGDVSLKVRVPPGAADLTLTVHPGTEHSPYWVHMRSWKPRAITCKAGEETGWTEVGDLLDTLNDGQWNLTAAVKQGKPLYDLEVGVRDAAGKIESVRTFAGLGGDVQLAYDADTRYSRRVRLADEVLFDLVAYLKARPVPGTAPKRTLVYGTTFARRPGDAKQGAAVDEFVKLMGATALTFGADEVPADGLLRGYADVRGVPTPKLEAWCEQMKKEGKAGRMAVVSLGDEIGLEAPPPNDHAGFRAWLKETHRTPADLDAAFGADWEKVRYDPTDRSGPAYYLSRLYAYRFGIRQLKARTDVLAKHLPNAGIGANFSPHHGSMYLGPTHQWISLFREGGMTMPWGEDYIWQVPVGSQQMNSIMVDMFRAAVKDRPAAKVHYYVMPHTPNNTPASWRRQFYGTLGHGAKVFNLFEFRPVQAAYTENHSSDPAMYQEIRRALHELGGFEDVVQDGRVRPGVAALWFSEAADVWGDNAPPFDAAKRCLYCAVRHQQLPLDVVVEGDDLAAYKVLYLTDRHVSRAAAKAIAAWVNGGGRLVATAGAGQRDEHDRPNDVLLDLLGVRPVAEERLLGAAIRYEKQDLPFERPLARAGARGAGLAAFGVRSVVEVKGGGVEVVQAFADGAPAWTRRTVGKGEAWCCAVLPGLAYFQPALPLRPMDRGSTDDSLTHFLPTAFDPAARAFFVATAPAIALPVVCSEALVETTVLEAKGGVVVPLVNWSKGPVKGLTVEVRGVPAKGVLASGRAVRAEVIPGGGRFTLDLDVADALILRP